MQKTRAYTPAMVHAEIELKFCVPDPTEFQARALRAGFAIQTERTLERNTLYDTPGRKLLDERQVLRTREYGGRWTVTHKKPPAHNDDTSMYKERVETETAVDDGEAIGSMFTELGFGPVFVYEKFRTELRGDSVEMMLDETPIGCFAELEGEPRQIDAALERLGVDPVLCFTDSYGRMFKDWKARSGSAAENMTFAEVEAARELVGVR